MMLRHFFSLLESKFCIEKVEKDEEKVLRLVSLVGLEALKKVKQICLPKKNNGTPVQRSKGKNLWLCKTQNKVSLG